MDKSLVAQLIGQRVLLTTAAWFYAPDGKCYTAAVGTLKAVRSAEATLGVRPNGRSANWYIELGRMVIAGCQVNYAIRVDEAVNLGRVMDERYHEASGAFVRSSRDTIIFDAGD